MKKLAIPLLIGIMFLFFLAPQAVHADAWTVQATNTVNQTGFLGNGTNTSFNISVTMNVLNSSVSIAYINITSVNASGWSITGSGPYNNSINSTTYGGGTIGGTVKSVNISNTLGLLVNSTQNKNATLWFIIGLNATLDGNYTFVMNVTTNQSGAAGNNVANYTNFTLRADYTNPVISFSNPTNTSTGLDKDFTLSITSDETSECRYNRNGSGSYGDMTLFTNTNATSHSFSFSGDAGKTYSYFFKCMDNSMIQNTNSDFTLLDFTTRGLGGGGGGGGGGGVPSIIPPLQVPSEVPQGLSVVPSQMMPPPEKGTMEIIGDAIQGIINWLKSLFGG